MDLKNLVINSNPIESIENLSNYSINVSSSARAYSHIPSYHLHSAGKSGKVNALSDTSYEAPVPADSVDRQRRR